MYRKQLLNILSIPAFILFMNFIKRDYCLLADLAENLKK